MSKEEELTNNADDKPKPAIILKFKTSSFSKIFRCSVCDYTNTQLINLRYHIRREHFNLVAKLKGREKRQINEVWLERVLNTDAVIEIKKAGFCKYLMKKSSDLGTVATAETEETSLDLGPLYPEAGRFRKKVPCSICKRKFKPSGYRKHLKEEHEDVII